jgi:HEXXH motif-containing protein
MTIVAAERELWDLDPNGETDRAAGRIPSLEKAGQPLTTGLVKELAARGLYVRSRDAHADLAIQRAGELIHRVPSLERIVLECVGGLIVLEPPDAHHDVSHSEPRWPDLIFVSLPPATPVGDIRLAEAVVHEAMHLNLSLAENRVQLVADDRKLYSPWRSKDRPASGVLHGTYVFAVLLRFFECLQQQSGLFRGQMEHLARRNLEIKEEFGQISREKLLSSLTAAGQIFAFRIFNLIDGRFDGITPTDSPSSIEGATNLSR